MNRFRSRLILFIFMSVIVTSLRGQTVLESGHQHLATTCVVVPAGEKRPEFGCFIVGAAKGLQFSQSAVYWHLREFPNRAAADAVKSPSGIVAEEGERVWLSEFGSKEMAPRDGKAVAVIGPLELLPAKTYDAELAYAVMRPGDRSRVHTHAGPEAWYVLSGEQCLETRTGTQRAHVGESMFVAHSVAMELSITGTSVRRALALVIHDSTQPFGLPSDWKPTGACGK